MSGTKATRASKLDTTPISSPSSFQRQTPAFISSWKSCALFLGLSVVFLLLESFVPLGSAVKLGGDEDFELSKTLLYAKGFHFYSEVWNDEPPFYPFLLGQVAQHTSFSILAARLLTVAFALWLLASLFRLSLSLGDNLRTAVLAVVLLIAAPGFLELASSCMVEIPTMAPVVAALAVLSKSKQPCWPWREIAAGFLFGLALQIKVIAVIYLPLAVLLLWLKHQPTPRHLFRSILIIGGMAGVSFILLNAITGCSFWLQVQQAWAAHFSGVKSFEYGSPSDRVFDWKLLLNNWDVLVPVIFGIWFLLRKSARRPSVVFAYVWLGLTLAIVSTHKPWWTNYYLHNAIPLCWCAAIALDAAFTWAGRRKLQVALISSYLLVVGLWMSARVYLQIRTMQGVPRLYSSLVLNEIKRYQPFTKFIFTTEGVYSFHSGIPLPPQLADISLKRLWSGDMTNARLAAELAAIKPGLILVDNQAHELPYHDLLQQEYRLVYQDSDHQLYALKSIIHLADP